MHTPLLPHEEYALNDWSWVFHNTLWHF